MKDDLDLISQRWLDENLPTDKEYYLRYFKTKPQEVFLRYYFVFRRYLYFTDHTGVFLAPRYIRQLRKKFRILDEAHERMLVEPDLEKRLELQERLFKGKYILGVR